MELRYAFVCEAATVSPDGKLNVLGIFSNITSDEFPLRMNRMVMVVSCTGQASDFGIHSLSIRLLNPDGRDAVEPLSLEIDINSEGGSTNVIGEYNGVEIKEPGPYSFEINIDSRHLASIPLEIAKINSQ